MAILGLRGWGLCSSHSNLTTYRNLITFYLAKDFKTVVYESGRYLVKRVDWDKTQLLYSGPRCVAHRLSW